MIDVRTLGQKSQLMLLCCRTAKFGLLCITSKRAVYQTKLNWEMKQMKILWALSSIKHQFWQVLEMSNQWDYRTPGHLYKTFKLDKLEFLTELLRQLLLLYDRSECSQRINTLLIGGKNWYKWVPEVTKTIIKTQMSEKTIKKRVRERERLNGAVLLYPTYHITAIAFTPAIAVIW